MTGVLTNVVTNKRILPVPYTKNRIFVTTHGKIMRGNNKPIKVMHDGTVDVPFSFGNITLSLSVVVLATFRGLKIHPKLWVHLEVEFVDGNHYNCSPFNTFFKMYSKKLGFRYKGIRYKIIQGYSRYAISESGLLLKIDAFNDKIKVYGSLGFTQQSGNKTCRVKLIGDLYGYSNEGAWVSGLHLMALSWPIGPKKKVYDLSHNAQTYKIIDKNPGNLLAKNIDEGKSYYLKVQPKKDAKLMEYLTRGILTAKYTVKDDPSKPDLTFETPTELIKYFNLPFRNGSNFILYLAWTYRVIRVRGYTIGMVLPDDPTFMPIIRYVKGRDDI